MSKLKKLLPKQDLRARWLWVLALALTAVKLGLCSFQLIVASPDLSPIDDTLMFNLAKSISAGNWLGEYDWLTLGKHSFYALWLAFLNLLHVNIVVGGQALFAVSCLVLLAALKPVMRTNWGRLFVFAVTLYTPASWAENTLRVYRDNIYPSLVLLALAGLLGAFTRFRENRCARCLIMLPPAFPLRRPGCATKTTRCCCRSFCARRRFILLICFWTKALRTKRAAWRCCWYH